MKCGSWTSQGANLQDRHAPAARLAAPHGHEDGREQHEALSDPGVECARQSFVVRECGR